MSNLDLAAETQQQQQKGLDSFLSQEERAALQRMLGFPEDIPAAFQSWLLDFVAVNIPQIPISQISGFPKSRSLELIISSTLAAAGTFDFQNISQEGFVHLQIQLIARGDTASAAVNTLMRVNGDTNSTYAWQLLTGSGASAGASEDTSDTAFLVGSVAAANGSANRSGVSYIDIPHYRGTAFHKEIQSKYSQFPTSGASGTMGLISGIWASTSAINRIQVFPQTGNFAIGSRCDLLGLRNPG